MFFDRPEAGRRAVVLHLSFKDRSIAEPDSPEECVELARSAGVEVVDTVIGSRQKPDPRAFIGAGKVEELKSRLAEIGADLVIANHALSPTQQRNLERMLGCRVMTRTELILHIFADRARTYEGKLQVELAQLQHAQTRLVRGWTHLERQKGGIGLRGGAGETQLELDQRMLAERVRATEQKLAAVEARRAQGRRRRQRGQIRTVALVGYTNAGKSSLFNALTAASVLAEDKLFATLDPTMRQLKIPGVGAVVLADTVGFVSHLPHALVKAFKATLEEVANADLLLHVVDAAGPDPGERIEQVNAVLAEIGARSLATIIVLNKMDALPRDHAGVPALGLDDVAVVPVSARTGFGLSALLEAIAAALGVSAPLRLMLGPMDGRLRAFLYRSGAVLEESPGDDGGSSILLQGEPALLDRVEREAPGLLQRSGVLPRLARESDPEYDKEHV
ncbi:MAG: GTPase HflX [Pseudomonadales bacterium]